MKILTKIKQKLVELIPPATYFFIIFSFLWATRQISMRDYSFSWEGLGIVIVGALLSGKVVLIADRFPFMNIFSRRPLIYNTAWKSFIYFLTSILLHYLNTIRHSANETVWIHFWLVQAWFALLFFIYCGLREIARVIGQDKIIQMFFIRRIDKI